jgi:hypothetical protein
VDQLAPEAKAGLPTPPAPRSCDLTWEHPLGKLPAKVGSPNRFTFQYDRSRAAGVFELVRTIMNSDFSSFADGLVISTFVDTLKSASTADVIDENAIKFCASD